MSIEKTQDVVIASLKNLVQLFKRLLSELLEQESG